MPGTDYQTLSNPYYNTNTPTQLTTVKEENMESKNKKSDKNASYTSVKTGKWI